MKLTDYFHAKDRLSRSCAAAVALSVGSVARLARRGIIYCVAVALTALFDTSRAGAELSGEAAGHTDELVPLIVIDAVPLPDVIRNIARQMDLNYIIDPRIFGPSEAMLGEPTISVRWHDLTIEEALQRVLKAYRLRSVTNPATAVVRIVPMNVVATPVPVDQVGTNTAPPIPVLAMDSVPLSRAIREIATRAGLRPSLTSEARVVLEKANMFPRPVSVSFRWTKITARQALAALLDNYDLRLIEDTEKSAAQIALKPPTESRPLQKGD